MFDKWLKCKKKIKIVVLLLLVIVSLDCVHGDISKHSGINLKIQACISLISDYCVSQRRVSFQKSLLPGQKRSAGVLNTLCRCTTRTSTSYRNTRWPSDLRSPPRAPNPIRTWIHQPPFSWFAKWFLHCGSGFPGDDADRSAVRGLLLHVEEVWALRLLCAAEPIWEEKVQQLSGSNVSHRTLIYFFILRNLGNVKYLRRSIRWSCSFDVNRDRTECI